MKKLFCIALALLACCSSLFALRGSDLSQPSKLSKILEEYKLPLVSENETDTLYKSAETNDWIFLRKIYSEENGDNNVFLFAFAYLGDSFYSFSRYGALLTPAKPYQYIYGGIDETNTALANVSVESVYDAGYYSWKDPSSIYAMLFQNRVAMFFTVYNELKDYNIYIPEDIMEKYVYFAGWFNTNGNDPKLKSLLSKEYKKYIKEHKK